jgi:hypothetical protein
MRWRTIAFPIRRGDELTAMVGRAAGFAAVGYRCAAAAARNSCLHPTGLEWISADGVTWTRRTFGGAPRSAPVGLISFGGKLLAVDDRLSSGRWIMEALESIDGTTWRRAPFSLRIGGKSISPPGLCHGEGGAVGLCGASFVASRDRLILTVGPGTFISSDGRTWDRLDGTGTRFQFDFYVPPVLAIGRSLLVGITDVDTQLSDTVDSTTPIFWWSATGSDWHTAAATTTSSPYIDEEVYGIAAVAHGFLALGTTADMSSNAPAQPECWSSVDGTSWTKATPSPGISFAVGTAPGGVVALSRNEQTGSVVASASSGDCRWTSADLPTAKPRNPGDSTTWKIASDARHTVIVDGANSRAWISAP